MMKKILILSVIFILAVSSGVFAADSEKFEEIIPEEISAQLELLNQLDIITRFEDGFYHLEDVFTRAQFAKVLVSVNPAYSLGSSATGTIFSDVPAEYWAADSIEALTKMGVLAGMPDGRFYPDETLQYNQMIKCLVTMLGYNEAAERKGGYPVGYLTIAASLRLKQTDAGDEIVTRKMAVELIYDALLAKPLLQTTFGTEESYRESEQSLLEMAHNIKPLKGRVDATQISGIGGYLKSNEGTIIVDGVLYDVPESISVYNLLGRYVTGYMQMTESDTKTILLLEENKDYETEFVYAKDVVSVKGFGPYVSVNTPEILYYDENERAETIAVKADANILINGSFVGYASDVSNIYSGKENLTILFDDNGDAETICVDRYEYYKIAKVDKQSLRIADEYGKEELCLERGKDFSYMIVMNGYEMTFEDLAENDFIAVGYSGDNAQSSDFLKIVVLNQKISGVLTERSEDTVVIDEKEYTKANSIMGDAQLEIGCEGVFYLGINGDVVCIEKTGSNSKQYAYLFGCDKAGGLNSTLNFKMLTQNGGIEYPVSAEEITLNGTITKAEEIEQQLRNYKNQMVTVRYDEEGKVKEINTIGSTEGPKEVSASYTGHNANGYLGMSYLYNDDSYIFTIPATENPEDSDYKATKISAAESIQRTLQVFDVSDTMEIGCVVYRPSSEDIATIAMASRAPAIVEKVTEVSNADGEVIKKVYLNISNQTIAYPIRSGFSFTKKSFGENVLLEQGDMILFSTNNSGEIDRIELLFDIRAQKNTEFEKWYSSTDGMVDQEVNNSLMYIAHGTVTNIVDGVATISVNGAERPFRLNSTQVTMLDKADAKKPFKSGYMGDITVGSRVFIRTTRYILSNVVMFQD